VTIRLYVVPLERTPTAVGPKYMAWRGDPTPEDQVGETARTIITYGEHDWAIAAVEAEAPVHDALAAMADVRAFPADLDATIASTQERNDIRNYLGAIGLPENWIVVGTPWREIVRTICGTVLFGIRIQGNLAIQWQNVPANVQDAAVVAGESLGYDMSFITPTTLVRNVLKSLADAWGDRPVLFGLNAYNGGTPFTV
jgi:hypothetical protein